MVSVSLFNVVRSSPVTRPLPTRIDRSPNAVTVLELMTVLVVISILAVMAAPVLAQFQARAQKAKCVANLRSLHVGTNLYVQDNHQWPQLLTAKTGDLAAAKVWVAAMQPYGLTQINWVCPTIQQLMQAPDLTDPANARIDYLATPFNTKPTSPFQQPRQPWYIESADVHGNGQEIIFPDGHIEEAADLIRAAQSPAGGSPGGSNTGH